MPCDRDEEQIRELVTARARFKKLRCLAIGPSCGPSWPSSQRHPVARRPRRPVILCRSCGGSTANGPWCKHADSCSFLTVVAPRKRRHGNATPVAHVGADPQR